MSYDGLVSMLVMDVISRAAWCRVLAEAELLRPQVDIELYDTVQWLRLEHPEVRTVVITSGKPRIFCAGANIACWPPRRTAAARSPSRSRCSATTPSATTPCWPRNSTCYGHPCPRDRHLGRAVPAAAA